jgi:hypothetical protein
VSKALPVAVPDTVSVPLVEDVELLVGVLVAVAVAGVLVTVAVAAPADWTAGE